MKKVSITIFCLFAFYCTYAVCTADGSEVSSEECAGVGGVWDEVMGCSCGETPTPLDESAGMFAGAIVVMGAYILYRKRK